MHDPKEIDWTRACIDGSVIQVKKGELTGPNFADRDRPGSKHHIITDHNGIPLVVGFTAANMNDYKLPEYMLDHLSSLRISMGDLLVILRTFALIKDMIFHFAGRRAQRSA